jgi:hypothetical protein
VLNAFTADEYFTFFIASEEREDDRETQLKPLIGLSWQTLDPRQTFHRETKKFKGRYPLDFQNLLQR